MYGQDAVLGLCLQNSVGTASVSSLHFMELLSEDLSLNIEQQMREGMRGIFDENPSQAGKRSVESNVAIEAHAIPLGFMLSALMSRTTTAVSSVFSHRFEPNQSDFDKFAANRPFTALVDLGDAGSAHQYYDLVASKMELNATQGGFVKATLGLMGGKYSQIAAVAGSFPTGDVVNWDSSSISLGGSGTCELEELTLTVEENLESIHTLCMNNSGSPNMISRSGKRTINIGGTIVLSDQTEYQKFLAQSTQVFKAYWVVNSDSVLIDAPQFKYSAFPMPVDGPGRLRASFEGRCEYHTGSASALAITVVNTQAAY